MTCPRSRGARCPCTAELSLAEFYCANTAIVGSLVLASDAAACNIGVQVGSPTAVRSGLSGHIVYEVVTTTGLQHFPQSMMTVQRRFSDFEWLHGRLCTQFPDIMLPLFPSKRVFGNQDDAFLKQRMAALHQYIVRCVSRVLAGAVLHAPYPHRRTRRATTHESPHRVSTSSSFLAPPRQASQH